MCMLYPCYIPTRDDASLSPIPPGGATSLPADTLEGPRAPWPYLDRKSIDIKAHAPGKPYILESLHFRPYLIEAPEFVDERDKRWFFSNGLTRRWLEESERCPTSIEGCGEAKRSGGRLLMRWEDLDVRFVFIFVITYCLSYKCFVVCLGKPVSS